MDFKKLIFAAKKGAIKHSPTILLVCGIAGMLTSVVWAVKETPKAVQAVKDARIEKQVWLDGPDVDPKEQIRYFDEGADIVKLTRVETFKTCWRYYLPSAIIFAASAACLIGGHTVSAKRNAALASLYAVTETTLRQYKDAIVENVDNEVKEKIENTVSQKQVQAAEDKNKGYIQELTPTSDAVLFCEPITGHMFRSTRETIRAAANDIKKDMLHDGYDGTATLGDFFDKLGLNVRSEIKDEIGWNISDNCLDDVFFSPQVDANGDPCLVLKYDQAPIRDYIYRH